MPAALPGVGPALPTAVSPAAASPAAASPAAASKSGAPGAAPGAAHGVSGNAAAAASGGGGPAADAAPDDAQAAAGLPPDFKTLLKEGLGRMAGAAAKKTPAESTAKKAAPAPATAAGQALAAAMAVLAPPLPAGPPAAAAIRPAGQASAAAPAAPAVMAASTGQAVTGAAAGPLADGFSLALAANSHAHAVSQPDAPAGANPAIVATDPAKIAASGNVLPGILPAPDARPAHTPGSAAAAADSSVLLPAGNVSALAGPASADVASAAPLPGNPPANTPAFADALGEKMVWMSKNDVQAAHLQLNPPDLGPLSIHLTVSDNQVSAYFVSPHEPVRDAIAAALPRLQEMMSGSGMTLGQANVGSESFTNANSGQGQGSPSSAWPGLAPDSHRGAEAMPAAWRPLARGRVDTFV